MILDDTDEASLRAQLSDIKREHCDLDADISAHSVEPGFNQVRLRRLKKRKLTLKDQIAHIESELIPNLNA